MAATKDSYSRRSSLLLSEIFSLIFRDLLSYFSRSSLLLPEIFSLTFRDLLSLTLRDLLSYSRRSSLLLSDIFFLFLSESLRDLPNVDSLVQICMLSSNLYVYIY